jgi:hypothetical protein
MSKSREVISCTTPLFSNRIGDVSVTWKGSEYPLSDYEKGFLRDVVDIVYEEDK